MRTNDDLIIVKVIFFSSQILAPSMSFSSFEVVTFIRINMVIV